ncbi:MAG: BolA/IbaG family iron-sulfur metabolism protein [bacterium]|nr:BolA/IbaG family iron-sulfur metabolism protein [bacterium]
MTQQELEDIIRGLVAVEAIEIEDMTGTQDHWKVMVVSQDFENKSRIDQHKLIFDPLQDRIKSNEIHALTLKTYTPDKWKKLSLS